MDCQAEDQGQPDVKTENLDEAGQDNSADIKKKKGSS